MPVGGRRGEAAGSRAHRPGATPGGGGAGMFAGQGGVIPPQDVAQVSTNWPAGNVDVRMANYLCQAQQKWTITAVPERAAVTPARRISRSPSPARTARWPPRRTRNWSSCPPSPERPEQLWRMDQLADGTWRIMPKSVPNSKEALALSAVGQQFRDAGEVRSQERETALAVQDAVT